MRTSSLARLLRDRTVVAVISSQFLASVAIGAIEVALGWQAYLRTGDPLVLGLIGLAEFIPAAVLAIPAGHAADRYDRRYVTLLGSALEAVVALLLAFEATLGDSATWPLYGLALALGAGRAYAGPAVTPLLAAAVTEEDFSQAVALSYSTSRVAIILGPVLGGFLQAVGDAEPYLAAAAASAVAGLVVMIVRRSVGREHISVAAERVTVSEALAGIRIIFAMPALLGAISLDLVAVLFGGATALLPVFAHSILHVGAIGNGLLRAAAGVGAVAVGVALTASPLRRRVGPTLFLVVALFGVFTVLFALSRNFLLSFVLLVALAGADMVSMVIRGTLGPMLTPPELRGRVGAVERVFIGASNELGAFESGTAAALMGPVGAVVLGGIASIAAAAVWAWGFPSLRRLDVYDDAVRQRDDLAARAAVAGPAP